MESSDKTTRWAFTAYEDQWHLFETAPPLVAEWGWQIETCPSTNRKHYQGYLRTTRQVRWKQVSNMFPSVHIEPAKNWQALVNYCKKTDTAVDGTQQHQTFQGKQMSMAQALTRLARYRPTIDNSRCETDDDFNRLYKREFEIAVRAIVREEENLIALYTQPQYLRAYVMCRDVWIEKAEEIDRQTDAEAVSAEIDDSRVEASGIQFLE